MKQSVGSSMDRVDGPLKVRGAAKYAAEFREDRLAHAVIVPATIAKGAVESVETGAAEQSAGVILVLTQKNFPAVHFPKAESDEGPYLENLTSLSDSKIHFAGQAVALVVAETLAQAEHASTLVRARYRTETPTLSFADNAKPPIYPAESHGEKVQYERGQIAAAQQIPGLITVEATYTTPVETHNPLEPPATVAVWDHGHLTLYDSTRWLMGTQRCVADALKISPRNVHVICPYVGGAFGSKAFRWSHTVLAAIAARETRRPVKLVMTRSQMFTWQGHRPPLVQNISLASGPDGRLVMLKHETTAATSPTSHFVAPTGVVSKITYSCPNVHASHKLLPVNRATPTWMRAPAEAPGSFALESAMDELAWALRMDPVELRLQNYAVIDPATGKLFSGKNLRVCYELGVQKFRWHERPAAPRSLTDGKTLVGWGMATASYPGHRRDCSARVRVCADGTATVQSAVHDIGTGAYTVFTQAAADALGLPVGAVKFQLGDSAFPNGPPAGGSVTTASTTEAIARAVGAAQAKLVKLTERIPNSPLHGVPRKSIAAIDGRIVDATHPARGLSYAEILTATGKPWIEAEGTAEEHDPKTKGFTIQSFGAHFCEVRIDPLLAEVKVSQFVSVFDVGRIINPKMARSQAYGGIVMGIGMALMEETVYDPRSGRPVTDSLADYHIPVNADIGTIDVTFVDEPDRHINLLGCRGVGEVPITGAAAAVANAVFHATGRRVRDLPITPDKLL